MSLESRNDEDPNSNDIIENNEENVMHDRNDSVDIDGNLEIPLLETDRQNEHRGVCAKFLGCLEKYICKSKYGEWRNNYPKLEQPVFGLDLRLKLGGNYRKLLTIVFMFLYILGYFVLIYFDGFAAETPSPGNGYYFDCQATILDSIGDICSNEKFPNCRWSTSFYGRCPRNCKLDFSGPVYGTTYYLQRSRICASALHAGVYTNFNGGCFKFAPAGMKFNVKGSTQNGITSLPFTFSARTYSFFSEEGVFHCTTLRWWMDLYVTTGLLVCTLIGGLKPVFYFFLIFWIGFWNKATDFPSNNMFIVETNSVSKRLFALFGIGYCLWVVAGKYTIPDPKRFPLDFMIFYFLPFWALGIHMDDFAMTGLNISFAEDVFKNSGYIAGFVLFFVVAIPLTSLQIRLYWKYGLLFKFILYLSFPVIFCTLILVIWGNMLSVHVHHFVFAMAVFPFTRGQTKYKSTIILQGFVAGVFVNGVARWDVAPLFDFDMK